jgi:mRNA interferase RelE/StbE
VSYAVTIQRKAQKELDAVSSPFYEKIEEELIALGDNPRPVGCQLMKGSERSWRIRIGPYRLIYEIDDKTKTVTVIKVGHRREVYR